MSDYNINAVTRRQVFSGSAGTGPYSFTFEVLDQDDLAVYQNATKLTLTTDYTVTVNANGTGDVNLVTAATSSDTVTIIGARDIERTTDFVTAGDLRASALNEQLDGQIIMIQQVAEENKRMLTAPVNDPEHVDDGGTLNMVLPAKADRVNKLLSFDSDGNPIVGEDIGDWKGNWAASTAYVERDLVKDTTNNNVYRVNSPHTSAGSLPLTTNTNSSKYDLVVDAASATTSATNAANSATDAETAQTAAETAQTAAEAAQTAAETAETNAETHKDDAETAKTAAEAAQAAAELAADNFDDTYLGAKSSDPSVDNDGDALNAGDLYFNTTSNTLKVYTGSAWVGAALTPSDFLQVSNNLSDLNNAATARTNIGLVIGTDVQAYDAGLSYLDGLNFTDEATFKAGVNLEIGTDVQAYDADLVAKDTNNTFTAAQRGSTDTDTTNTGSVTLDFDTNQNFVLTLTGNVTLANPTTEAVGQSGFIVFIQDATGGRTVSLGTDYETAGAAGLTLSTAASTTDIVPYVVAASGRILLGAPQLAFS